MFPQSLHSVDRSLAGPLAVYAPRSIGTFKLWRGFPVEPWSPDIDLVVGPLIGAASGIAARYLVDEEHRFIARRASRGVRLSEVLAASDRALPPVELTARVALALLRPGPRVADIVGPSQIVIGFDGDVHVDGLDPEAHIHVWAPVDATGIDAALVAACAAGVEDWQRSNELVRRASGNLICALAEQDRDACLEHLAKLPKDRAVVAGLVRSLFPHRAAAADEVREELALLDRRVLPAWEHTVDVRPPLAPRPATFSVMRDHAVNETALVLREAEALGAEMRASVTTMRALFAPPPSWRVRLARFVRSLFAPPLRPVFRVARLPRRRPPPR